MEIVTLELVFLSVYTIEMYIQAFMFNKFVKNSDYKDFITFLSFNISVFICNIVVCIMLYRQRMGFISSVFWWFLLLYVFGYNIALFAISIVGYFIKKRKNVINYTSKGSAHIASFEIIFFVLLVNCMIMVVYPNYIDKTKFDKGQEFVYAYLNQKYGESDYQIVEMSKKYRRGGLFDLLLDGYYFEISNEYVENTFVLHIDKSMEYVVSDFYLPVYYSEQLGLYYTLYRDDSRKEIVPMFTELSRYLVKDIEEKYSIGFLNPYMENFYRDFVIPWKSEADKEYQWNYYIIADDYGRIPTLEEVEELIVNNFLN